MLKSAMAVVMPNTSKLLIKNIKALMEQQDMKQADLARRLGWEPAHLSKYLSGTTEPGLGKITEIANVFGVSVASLFSTEETPTPAIERPYISEELRAETADIAHKAALQAVQTMMGLLPKELIFSLSEVAKKTSQQRLLEDKLLIDQIQETSDQAMAEATATLNRGRASRKELLIDEMNHLMPQLTVEALNGLVTMARMHIERYARNSGGFKS
jgi:transcriptional regulator with XRE-family HTH domain